MDEQRAQLPHRDGTQLRRVAPGRHPRDYVDCHRFGLQHGHGYGYAHDPMTREAPSSGTNHGGAAFPASEKRGDVIAFPVPEGDEALVTALRAQHPSARAVLFERHATHVRRVLVRVLGLDQEVPDLLQDVFLTALSSVRRLQYPRALRPWLTGIAVHSARALIRKRARRRILGLVDPEKLDREIGPASGADSHEAIRALYRVLDELPADERIAFALRFV